MREQPEIPEEDLRACLEDRYDLYPVTLEFLPLGLDYNAGVYRVVSEQGTAYLLKVTSRTLYESQCLVPRYLNDQGITSVVAPIPTRSGALWTRVEEWTVIVYPFIDGDTSWTGMTNEQWNEVGTIFQQIHQVRLSPEGFESLRVVTSLEKLAGVLQSRTLPYVICHADLHPANLLRDHAGHVFVIDWDEVMLAPKERDFLFVKESLADCEALPGTPAFFQGYGQTEIDWIALTYYRYERVVQDLIACAQEVFFRDDLGEGTKADSVQLFHAILAEGGEIDAASQASAHLPSDLTIPTRMISRAT
jgi:spectinomycin phosphotransferase